VDNQNFINFSDNSSSQSHISTGKYDEDKRLFQEIFASLYGVHNLTFIKDAYFSFLKVTTLRFLKNIVAEIERSLKRALTARAGKFSSGHLKGTEIA